MLLVFESPGQTISTEAYPQNSQPESGDSVLVSVKIDMNQMPPPDHRLGSFTCQLKWDPSVIQYKKHFGLLGGLVGFVNSDSVSEGKLIFNGVQPLGLSGEFEVIKLSFMAVGNSGSSSSLSLYYSAMASAVTFRDLLPFLRIKVNTVTVNNTSSIEPDPDLFMPQEYQLNQNYPNPFNPRTTISYYLPHAAPLRLSLFDIRGGYLLTLVDDYQFAGHHDVIFDGEAFSSGIYFYRLESPEFTDTRKMILQK